MGSRYEQTIHHRGYPEGQQMCEKMFITASGKRNENQGSISLLHLNPQILMFLKKNHFLEVSAIFT